MRLPVAVSTVMDLTFVGGGRGTAGAETGALAVDASVRQYGVLFGARRIVLHGEYRRLGRIELVEISLIKAEADEVVTESVGTNAGEVFMMNVRR